VVVHLEVKFEVKVFCLKKYLFFRQKRKKKYFARKNIFFFRQKRKKKYFVDKYFFSEAKEEKNNSTGVYKYISIRIPLDYIFDCRIKKYILLIYYKPWNVNTLLNWHYDTCYKEIFTKTVYVRVKYQLSMSRFIRDRSTVCLSFLTNVFIWEVSGGCLGKRVGTPILHRSSRGRPL